MTDPIDPEGNESIAPKEKLKASLLRLRDRLGRIERDLLTPRQYALVTDCAGLLHAMLNGHQCRERSQIRDRLIEAISLFGGPDTMIGDLPREKRILLAEISLVLDHVSQTGIALENGGRPTGQLGSSRS